MNEGYIKFRVHLSEGEPPHCEELALLNTLRTELYDLGLIGVLSGGIGYGNISLRPPDCSGFIISGTATGAQRILAPEGYCRVDSFDPAANEVFCTGRIRASSESMSHGAVYRANRGVRCVIHVHSRELFEFLLAGNFPRTSGKAEFGTPELAAEIEHLVRSSGTAQGIFATAGHRDGVITYGSGIEPARQLLLDVFRKASSREANKPSAAESPLNPGSR